jgi:hypothetical protein
VGCRSVSRSALSPDGSAGRRRPVGAEKAVRGCHQDLSCHSPKGEDASSWCSRSSTWHSYA